MNLLATCPREACLIASSDWCSSRGALARARFLRLVQCLVPGRRTVGPRASGSSERGKPGQTNIQCNVPSCSRPSGSRSPAEPRHVTAAYTPAQSCRNLLSRLEPHLHMQRQRDHVTTMHGFSFLIISCDQVSQPSLPVDSQAKQHNKPSRPGYSISAPVTVTSTPQRLSIHARIATQMMFK